MSNKEEIEESSFRGATIFVALLTLLLIVLSAGLVFVAIAGLLRGDWIMCIIAAVLAILAIWAIGMVLRVPVNLERQAKARRKAER